MKAILAVALCFSMSLPVYGMERQQRTVAKTTNIKKNNVKNSFLTPDFAYPKDVASNAQPAYDKALAAGDGLTALRAAIQLNIAGTLTDAEGEAGKSLQRYAELGVKLPAPWSSLALLLQGELYSEIYDSDSWNFDNRKLPLDNYPANVQEWSGDMFAMKTLEAVRDAVAGLTQAGDVSLSEIKDLLSNTEGAIKAGMTVGDFVRLKGAAILSGYCRDNAGVPLRFGNAEQILTPQEQCSEVRGELYKQGMARSEADGNTAMSSTFAYKLYGVIPNKVTKRKFLDECYRKYGNTEWGADFVLAYVEALQSRQSEDPALNGRDDVNAVRRQALEILTAYNTKFPKAPSNGSISNAIENLRREQVGLSLPEKVLPGKEFKCAFTAANVYDFKLLIYKLPDAKNGYVQFKDIRTGGKQVCSVPVVVKGSAPDIVTDSVVLPGLAPDNYVVMPSTDGTLAGVIRDKDDRYFGISALRVTDMSYLVCNDGAGKRLYIVDARNQRPLPGVKVYVEETVYNGKGRVWNLVTDNDGGVALSDKRVTFRAVRGESYVSDAVYGYGNGRNVEKPAYIGRVLTDLSIYKPGQDVGFAGILGLRKGHGLSEVKRQKILFTLYDANGQQVDTLSAMTDDKGRASGMFRIPTDGLLGNYRVQMQVKKSAKEVETVSSVFITVADYKSPSFRVFTEKVASHFALGDTLRISGKALTYSGMPVADGEVSYTVKYTPWRFWWGAAENDAEFNGNAMTGADGGFNIELPTATIRNTPYERGVFTLTVKVTDGAGETHEAQPVRFSFAAAYSLAADISDMIEAGNGAEVSLGTVKLTDMVGYPVDRKIYYTVKDKSGAEVRKGECDPGEIRLKESRLPSGAYTIAFALNPEMKEQDGVDVSVSGFTVWRADDRVPAEETPLWVPVTKVVAEAGQKSVEVPVGSSYNDSYILCSVDNGDKLLKKEWIKISEGIVRVNVESPDSLSRVFVNLAGMHDFECVTALVTVVPEVQTKQVEISTESFRDRMAPGDEELWKFRFTIGGKPMVQRPVLAVMSNKALNVLAPFSWSLNPAGNIAWYPATGIGIDPLGICSNSFRHNVRVKDSRTAMFGIPYFDTYGRMLYMGMYGGVMYDLCGAANGVLCEYAVTDAAPRAMATSQKKMRSRAMSSAKAEAVEEADEESREAGSADAGGASESVQEELRPVEMPLAFFMPDLLTDGDGVACVNFMVPNFNGTWQFQIAGYTPDMKGTVQTHDVVAARQVMVRMNAPRFLRTGDKAQISATLFNNSDAVIPVGGRIDILNSDGKVLKSQEFAPVDLNVSGQRTVTIDYDVPGDMSEVEVRAYAVGGRHRDGEGLTVPVLPSSTPVIESKTFYAGPGAGDIRVDIPRKAKNGMVTLQYCGNPVWECVTALPSMLNPGSANILAHVNALYGTAIVRGLMHDYPQLAVALRTFAAPDNAGDSTLVSNLEKNQQLKAVTLNNTPWVNNAKDETRRMQSLVEYLDADKSEKTIDAVMKVLKERQNNDGGWSWCPDMPTSGYITGRVLLHFAMLKGMGYLPEDAEALAVKGFGFVDRELAQDWEKTGRKYFSVTGMLNYLYVKSFFPEVKDVRQFEPLRGRALKAIEEEWKDFDIYNKATAVTLEYRLGKRKLAAEILESLRQFATVTPEKGMCFENLKGGFSGWNPLITTAQVLEAYGEAAPKDEAVDELRQWLLMSKQTQDWGAMLGTAEVVQAILSTGSDWTVSGDVAGVTVDGEEIPVPARAKITDSFTLTLTPEQVKRGDIVVEKKSAGPAWGGVVSQYVAPILDVKSEGVPQLRIDKNVYAINGGKAVADNLKVGDRVRVTLTITTDRDMDYVAVIDNRSACLEPADQLSGYAASDGVWMYREVRDMQTNLFIPFLPKGTSVISYECYVDRAGEYTLGIAQAQSQYAPVITAHSCGVKLTVK